MTSQIKCPYCNKLFEPSEAFKHELEEKLSKETAVKHKEEIEAVKKKVTEEVKTELQKTIAKDLKDREDKIAQLDKQNKEIEEKNRVDLEEVKKQAEQTAVNKFSKELKDRDEQIKELELRSKRAEDEELKIRKEKRQLEQEKEKFEIEKMRQLDEERDKIKTEAVQGIVERDKLKFDELEKKLKDTNEALKIAMTKGDQTSQQLQGEVQELELEHILKVAFPDDEIMPVGKGKEGADVIQKVRGKSGRVAGIILWESKRAKWKPSWLSKLREDARKESASVAVLAATNLPHDVNDFKLTEGVILCFYRYAIPLAGILRRSILLIAVAKQTAASKDEDLELLYNYLQSEDFRHRFEAFAEGIQEMFNDLDSEKRSMERVWKKREGQIKKTQLNAARMYGEFQGVMGNALPEIKILSLPGAIIEKK